MPATVLANSDDAGQADEPAVPLPAWELGAREDLVQREYWVTWQEETQLDGFPAAWHAPNRAQNLRAYFTPEAVRLIPRTSSTPEWSWSLSLVGYGRGSSQASLEPARLFPDENRIRLDRGKLEEWFVNEPKGLKHGFVLQAPPDGAEPGVARDPVYIDLEVGGTLTPSLGADRQSISFADSSGIGSLYYDGLVVRDATGRSLRSWMETSHSSNAWVVRLVVDDSTATYPIEIDPLATTTSWTGELDSIDAWFGFEVNTAGDVNGDGYDDVIVGAFHYDNGFVNEGAAFVYHGSPTGPSTAYDWHVEGEEAVAFAGRSVGPAGDVNGDGYDDVIVGVPLINSRRGAWVFHGSASGLSASANWFPTSPLMSGSSYGQAVGPAGDVNGDGYDDVIVGAATHGSPGFNQDGQAYVFHGSAAGLAWTPAWSGKGGQDNAAFGIAVGAAGDVNGDGYGDVVVGAYKLADGEDDEGRALVYHGSATGLSTTEAWSFENDVVGACLGGSVSAAGDVNGDGYDDVVVGAAYRQCFNFPSSPVGKAYGFHGSAAGLSTAPDWNVELAQTGALFGGLVASAGDVNDDGYDDVVVGAAYYDNELTDEGAAWVYLGSASGLDTSHTWMVEGNQGNARYGQGAATAGDVNGDGASDLIVGAYAYDNGEDDEGRAYIYLGTPNPVAAGRAGSLVLDKAVVGEIQLSWAASCLGTDSDYAIYEGALGDFTSHAPVGAPNPDCTTGGATSATITPAPGDRYYLVVPLSSNREGSLGTDNVGNPRPQGTSICRIRETGSCP